MTYKEYINYFEDIAKKHIAINHKRTDEQLRFIVLNIDEFYSLHKNRLSSKGIHFLLYNYERNINTNKNGNLFIEIDGGFAIIGYYDGSYQNSVDVADNCESICGDIILKMQHDSKLNTAIFKDNRAFDNFQDVSLLPFKPTKAFNYVGFQTFFKFNFNFSKCLDLNKFN